MAAGRRSPERRRDHGSGVVRLPVRRAGPPEPAGVVAAGDDAELGDEPARQAAEHGVRAGRREAGRRERSPGRQSARRDDRGAAAGREGARSVHPGVDAATRAIDELLGLRRGGAREADRRHLAHRPQRPDPVGAGERQAAGCASCSGRSRSGCSSGSAAGCSSSSSRRWTLDTVVGHEAAKARLREDAALLKRGALDSLPMGYLLCGPVGTGKSFLAQCVSGEIGVPCVILKNFRSKYVGETEGNLERVLSVLRAMGPVVVVVDEADAALGSREQDGDSGTSSRVFAHDRGADGRHAVPRPHHLDAADRASRSAADRSQAPGARGGAHPAVLSDRRERDPADVRHPGEEARIARWRSRTCRRFRSAGNCRARTSKAWSAAPGARRCWPAPIT